MEEMVGYEGGVGCEGPGDRTQPFCDFENCFVVWEN